MVKVIATVKSLNTLQGGNVKMKGALFSNKGRKFISLQTCEVLSNIVFYL